MNSRERGFLLSERATLEKMLREISPKSVIGRMSLEQRKKEVEERIAALEQEPIAPPRTSHDEHSESLLAHAQEMIDKGDRLQASEKIWGAVAHKVKGIARRRGWGYSHHADGGVIVDYIAERMSDAEMAPLFDSIENLHQNFYEDVYSLPRIRQRLERAKRLISLLRGAHDAMPPDTPMPDDREYRRRVERQARRAARA